ncbi:hypothetical protein HPP92_001420 [Vanilla planifolia]|uniref:DET1- and DDB1-associated protein 1 domain-containing protein n=1 Tax=Vanilla planifolia TaxID=51239 RepID=A0A835RRN0_VANPL|nr:hypothetical protein HPP92_001420 [Vanilla planifolia]
MDDESSGSPTPTKEKRASLLEHDGVGGGASKYLKDLPSRGLFSSRFPSSNLGSIRVYVCDHDTTPPEDQVIKTNATNILIRSLQLSKQKNDAKDAKASMEVSRGKKLLQDCWMANLQPKEPTQVLLLAVRDQVLGYLRGCFTQ